MRVHGELKPNKVRANKRAETIRLNDVNNADLSSANDNGLCHFLKQVFCFLSFTFTLVFMCSSPYFQCL